MLSTRLNFIVVCFKNYKKRKLKIIYPNMAAFTAANIVLEDLVEYHTKIM